MRSLSTESQFGTATKPNCQRIQVGWNSLIPQLPLGDYFQGYPGELTVWCFDWIRFQSIGLAAFISSQKKITVRVGPLFGVAACCARVNLAVTAG